jgi:WD40 repeat protein
MKKALLFLVVLILKTTPSVFAQCKTYECALDKAKDLLKSSSASDKYEKAMSSLDDADDFAGNDNVKKEKVRTLRKQVFKAIENEKNAAIKSEKKATQFKNEAKNMANTAVNNQKRAEIAEQKAKNNALQLEKQQVSLEKIRRLNRNINATITAIRKEITDPTLALNMMDYILKNNPNDFGATSKMKDILSDSANIFYSKKIPIKDSIRHFAFNEKKRVIIGGGFQGDIIMWDFEGNELRTIKTADSWITGIEFSPDGSFFYASSISGWVKTWTLEGELLKTFQIFAPVENNAIASFDLSENGEYFVIGGQRGVVKVFDKSGTEISTFGDNDKDLIWHSYISSDGKTIIYAPLQNNDTIKLRYLDKTAPKYLKIKQIPNSSINLMKFIEKDSFAVCYNNGVVQKYSSKGVISSVKEDFKMTNIQVYRQYISNNSVLTGNNNIVKILLANRETYKLPIYASYGLKDAFMTDSFNNVITCDSKYLYLWNLANIIERKIKIQNKGIVNIRRSMDGKLLLLGGNDSIVSVCDTNGRVLYKLGGHKEGDIRYQFSSDNKLILTLDEAGIGRIWTVQGQLIGTLVEDKKNISGAIFSTDNLSIITFGKDSTLSIWDFKGKIIKKIRDSAQINCIGISPNGENILIGNLAEKVNSYNLKTGQLNFSKYVGHFPRSITFSKDGSYYLVNLEDRFNVHHSNGDFKYSGRFENVQKYNAGNYGAFINVTPSVIVANDGFPGTMGVWDSTGKKIWESGQRRLPIISFHTSDTTSLDMILTSASNGTIALYNRKGELMLTQNAHVGSANQAIFIDNNMKIMSVGEDGILSIRPNRYALWQSKQFAQYSLAELAANDLELEPEDYEKITSYEDIIVLSNMYAAQGNFRAAKEKAEKAFNLKKDVKIFSSLLNWSYKLKESLDLKMIGTDTTLLKETLSLIFKNRDVDTLFLENIIRDVITSNNTPIKLVTFNFLQNTILFSNLQGVIFQYKNMVKIGEVLLNEIQSNGTSELQSNVAGAYSALGFFALWEKDFVLFNQTLKRGIELDSNRRGIKVNIAHQLFFKKRFEECKSFILSIKDSVYISDVKYTYGSRLLEDFEIFESKEIITKEYQVQFDEIKKILKESIKQLRILELKKLSDCVNQVTSTKNTCPDAPMMQEMRKIRDDYQTDEDVKQIIGEINKRLREKECPSL